jgi:hypothetical protein
LKFPHSSLALSVEAQLAHVNGGHAIILHDMPSIVLALAETHQTLLAQHVEAEAFCPIIQRLGCEDDKHGLYPHQDLFQLLHTLATNPRQLGQRHIWLAVIQVTDVLL